MLRFIPILMAMTFTAAHATDIPVEPSKASKGLFSEPYAGAGVGYSNTDVCSDITGTCDDSDESFQMFVGNSLFPIGDQGWGVGAELGFIDFGKGEWAGMTCEENGDYSWGKGKKGGKTLDCRDSDSDLQTTTIYLTSSLHTPMYGKLEGGIHAGIHRWEVESNFDTGFYQGSQSETSWAAVYGATLTLHLFDRFESRLDYSHFNIDSSSSDDGIDRFGVNLIYIF